MLYILYIYPGKEFNQHIVILSSEKMLEIRYTMKYKTVVEIRVLFRIFLIFCIFFMKNIQKIIVGDLLTNREKSLVMDVLSYTKRRVSRSVDTRSL